jgi:hypothetical protein
VIKAAPARNKLALTRTAVGGLPGIREQPTRVEKYLEQDDVCYAPRGKPQNRINRKKLVSGTATFEVVRRKKA